MLSSTPVFSIDIPSQIVIRDYVSSAVEDEVMPTETYDVTEITPNENNSFIVVEPKNRDRSVELSQNKARPKLYYPTYP